MLEKIFRNLNYYLNIKGILTYKKFKRFTMIPYKSYVENLMLAKRFSHIEGDVVECGTWRGGMIAGVAVYNNEKDKNYYLFDSFEGLPDAKEIDGKSAIDWQKNKDGAFYFDNCTADESQAIKAMNISGAKYIIEKGWFDETLQKNTSIEKISILRLDGDWYDSTMVCLDFLFDKVTKGGVIIIDDYYAWDGCSRATHDYLSKHKLSNRIQQFNNTVCYIIK